MFEKCFIAQPILYVWGMQLETLNGFGLMLSGVHSSWQLANKLYDNPQNKTFSLQKRNNEVYEFGYYGQDCDLFVN